MLLYQQFDSRSSLASVFFPSGKISFLDLNPV